MIRIKMMLVFAAFLAAAVLCISDAALAATLAYYECEGPVGTVVADSNGRLGPLSAGTPLIDSSGNGNTAYGWTGANWGNWLFQANVPAPTVTQTGAPDTTSVHSNWENGAWWPVITTCSALTHPTGTDLETAVLPQWTLEASFTQHWLGGYNTIIGYSGEAPVTQGQDPNLSKLYFQKNNLDLCRIQFVDNAGNIWGISDTNKIMNIDTWYQMAATSDGQTLKLYDNVNQDGTPGAFHLAATLDISSSTDSSMAHLNNDGSHGWWMFGAGDYAGNDGDRLNGNLDNIRISDTALSMDQMLCVPEPATLVMLVLAGALGLLYTRLRKR